MTYGFAVPTLECGMLLSMYSCFEVHRALNGIGDLMCSPHAVGRHWTSGSHFGNKQPLQPHIRKLSALANMIIGV
jgi:hypothetical protein